MSWAKLDDRANEHRKQLAAGPEACWFWACGLMYANRQRERDGFIPEAALGMLYPVRSPKKLADRLVEAGLWERVEGGYRIHDFHDWNQTKEQREAELASGRERAAQSYERRKLKNQVSSPEELSKKQNSSGSTPTPTPTPTPKTPTGSTPVGPHGDAPGKPAPTAKRAQRWRRVPSDWEPNASHRELAAGLRIDFGSALAAFRDHEFKDPKSDADAAFRNWIRRTTPVQTQIRLAHPRQDASQQNIDRQLERLAEARAEEARKAVSS